MEAANDWAIHSALAANLGARAPFHLPQYSDVLRHCDCAVERGGFTRTVQFKSCV